jgi:hypothetical protein
MVTHIVSSNQQCTTKLSKVGERALQGSLQSNKTQHQGAAHNPNHDTALQKRPHLHPHAKCGTSEVGSSAPRIQPEPVCAVWRPAAAVSIRERQRHCTTDSWRYTVGKQTARWCPGWGKTAWLALQRFIKMDLLSIY